MERLSARYEQKLIEQQLADPGAPVFGDRDAEITWNRDHAGIGVLENIFDQLNINALLFSRPAEPYRTIIDHLAQETTEAIFLKDNETRTFLHDIPIAENFSAKSIVERLKHRKCAIVRNYGIIAYGTVSPEQAFVHFSSVLFSCFVKFFADHLSAALAGTLSQRQINAFDRVLKYLAPFPEAKSDLRKGPFTSVDSVIKAVCEAGKPVVAYGLVDSVMGNISYRFNDVLYISQTGSFLDALEDCIDPCPIDNSSCAGITASSELPTHLQIVKNTPYRAVLHGHPKFSVIMSMICEKEDNCPFAGQCHIKCPEKRFIQNIPIVPGESGAGPRAIVNTVPRAIRDPQAVIVYGHGVFVAGTDDFNLPFLKLCEIEWTCREQYFERLAGTGVFV
jgi:ribulose-5-phosphate 4-epimerase/fuculose-1-phosphate aldolase